MVTLKIIGCLILGLYGLYLAVGLAISLPEILRVIDVITNAPLKLEKIPESEYEMYRAPLPEVIKQIPGLLKDWWNNTVLWTCLPFVVMYALMYALVAKTEEST
jgi:hypothetical protein